MKRRMLTNEEIDSAIHKAALGDINALKEVYEDCAQAVYLMAYTVTKNQSAADDVVQDTFLTVYDKAAAYRSAGKGRSWILGIAKNIARRQVQKQQKYRLQESFDTRVADTAPRFEAIIEQNMQVKRLLSVLSEREQDIVVLHVLADIKLKDIAALLRIPLGSVYWSYSNARHKMEKCLAEDEETTAVYR